MVVDHLQYEMWFCACIFDNLCNSRIDIFSYLYMTHMHIFHPNRWSTWWTEPVPLWVSASPITPNAVVRPDHHWQNQFNSNRLQIAPKIANAQNSSIHSTCNRMTSVDAIAYPEILDVNIWSEAKNISRWMTESEYCLLYFWFVIFRCSSIWFIYHSQKWWAIFCVASTLAKFQCQTDTLYNFVSSFFLFHSVLITIECCIDVLKNADANFRHANSAHTAIKKVAVRRIIGEYKWIESHFVLITVKLPFIEISIIINK